MNKKAKKYFNYDRFMRLPRYPSHRGGGMYHPSHITYQKGDCKCINCLYWRPKSGCSQIQCPFIEERVESGDAKFKEVFDDLLYGLNNAEINNRVTIFIKESKEMDIKFNSKSHQERFERTLKGINKKHKALVAAVYLLTADRLVWNQCWSRLQYSDIPLERIRLHNSNNYGYTLFCAAKDLYLGTKYITIEDLADWSTISQREFSLICNAVAIKRYGVNSIYLIDDERR